MGLTPTRAYFCISDPNVDVTNSKVYPFIFLAHKLVAKKMIIMPLKHFHRVAAELGDPCTKVACIHMTTRCGSTLMCQAFNEVPGVQVLSEPYVTLDIQRHYINNKWTKVETEACIRSTVRLILKPVHKKRVDLICWKMAPFANNHNNTVMKYFPNFKWIFNTRTLKDTINSRVKMINSQPLYFNLTGKYFSTSFWAHLAVNRENEILRDLIAGYQQSGFYFNRIYTPAEMMALGVFSFYASYLENRKKYDIFVLYEDLAKDPKGVMTNVFKAIGLDLKYLEAGLIAFKRDSQQGILGQRGTKISISDKEWLRMDGVAEKLNLPIRSFMTADEMREALAI